MLVRIDGAGVTLWMNGQAYTCRHAPQVQYGERVTYDCEVTLTAHNEDEVRYALFDDDVLVVEVKD